MPTAPTNSCTSRPAGACPQWWPACSPHPTAGPPDSAGALAESASSRFADHALGTRFADLPPAAAERAKAFVLDSLGVGIAGSSTEGSQELLAVAGGWGGPAAVPVW